MKDSAPVSPVARLFSPVWGFPRMKYVFNRKFYYMKHPFWGIHINGKPCMVNLVPDGFIVYRDHEWWKVCRPWFTKVRDAWSPLHDPSVASPPISSAVVDYSQDDWNDANMEPVMCWLEDTLNQRRRSNKLLWQQMSHLLGLAPIKGAIPHISKCG